MTDFASLNLTKPIAKALAAAGYTTPTPIQIQAIPLVKAGHDILGIAQTGTGKTAAFALPILDMLNMSQGEHNERKKRSTRVLVLAPTRELAAQIAESFRTYGRFIALRTTTAFGGVPINRQIKAIVPGVDVLVATPGRLLDLIDQRVLSISDVEVLVLDEADQMLDLGFIHALKRIVQLVPKKRQTLFFSATMPNSISDLAGRYLTNPKQVSVAPTATTAERVEQRVTFVNQSEKVALLTMTLNNQPIERALVFSRTKHGADKIVRHLAASGITAAAIHGNKSQPQRTRALQAFKAGECKILIATDIAARGIDVDGVSHVINFDMPNVPEQYVHRIGRTARAGKSGLAISFVAGDERPFLRDIERLTGKKAHIDPLPDNFMAEVKRVKALRPAPKPRDEQGRKFGGPKNGQRRGGPRGGNSPKGQKHSANRGPNRGAAGRQRRTGA